eukprot:433376_1
MATTAGDELVIATIICTCIAFIIITLAFAQLCVSPLVGSELKAFKYRLVNCLISLAIMAEALCSILHYQNTTNPTTVITYIMTRAFVLCVLCAGGIMFLLTTFDTLYQSTLAKQSAPNSFHISIKLLSYIFPTVIIFCVLYAFNQDEIFWIHILGIFVTAFPATLSIVIMIGLIIVIRSMNIIRRAIEKNDHNTETLNDEKDSNHPQKHSRSRALKLRKKANQLTILSVMLSVYWVGVVLLVITRSTDLKTPQKAGTVYQKIMDLKGYLGSMIAQFFLAIMLIIWPWEKIDCDDKKHRQKFTMCYLCCMGEPDPTLQKKKSITNVISHLADRVKTPGTPVPIDLKANASGKVSAFIEDEDFAGLGQLVPMVSFPHQKGQSQYIPVKICIFNIEVLFFNVDLFLEMRQSSFNLNELDKARIIEDYLGGDAYYKRLVEHLSLWSEKDCVLFVAHSWLAVSKLKELLLKLNLLQFFVGDTMNTILERKSKDVMKVDWNQRIIGRRSDYIELLKDEESDYFDNVNSNKSEKQNKEQQLLKSMHLLILQFIKIWNVQHDEILYIDYHESITNYMKQINVCKILQVNSHQVGKMKLQEMAEKDKIPEGPNMNDPHQLIPSLSIHLGEVIETGEHPIMTTGVMTLINNLILS